MASLRKRNEFWYIRYRDETGKQTERKASRDKSVAKSMMKSIEDKVTGLRLGTLKIADLKELEAERVLITQHAEDYFRNLEAKCVPEHVVNVRHRLGWFLEETKISRLSQLSPSIADIALRELKDQGVSDQTLNHYAVVWKSFANWLKTNHRTKDNALDGFDLPEINMVAKRSALTSDQTIRLIAATRAGKSRCRMSGEDRSWLYLLASITGLRRGELQSLTPGSFSLTGDIPVVSLPGTATKNGEPAVQPLPAHVVQDLRSWLFSRPVDRPLWPPERNTALMIRADLKAAGIAPEPFDFHCLRHSYATQISQCGGSVKDTMELTRHHDPNLTFNTYAHSRLEDRARTVDRLPDLLAHGRTTNGVPAGLNGTTTESTEPSPEQSQVDPLGHVDRLRQPSRPGAHQRFE